MAHTSNGLILMPAMSAAIVAGPMTVKRAQRFPTIDAAMRYWQAQSRVVPYRPDGIVNRPLTAYHVTVERVEDQND
jgi:hypothetical protein